MSTKNGNEPAYPVQELNAQIATEQASRGFTKRELIAKDVYVGLLIRGITVGHAFTEVSPKAAKDAVKCADDLLKALEDQP